MDIAANGPVILEALNEGSVPAEMEDETHLQVDQALFPSTFLGVRHIVATPYF